MERRFLRQKVLRVLLDIDSVGDPYIGQRICNNDSYIRPRTPINASLTMLTRTTETPS